MIKFWNKHMIKDKLIYLLYKLLKFIDFDFDL